MRALLAILLAVSGSVLAVIGEAKAQDAIHVTSSGDVGVGTNSPVDRMHLLDGNFRVEQSSGGVDAVLNFETPISVWEIKQNGDTGRLTFSSPQGAAITAPFKFDLDATENLFRVGVLAGNTVDINGNLVVNGTDITPDYVFEEDYPLESIEEHARQMWENKHLPAMTSSVENANNGVDIIKHQYGVLEELEKAHIYIAQLHDMVKELRVEVAELKGQQQEREKAVRLSTTD